MQYIYENNINILIDKYYFEFNHSAIVVYNILIFNLSIELHHFYIVEISIYKLNGTIHIVDSILLIILLLL